MLSNRHFQQYFSYIMAEIGLSGEKHLQEFTDKLSHIKWYHNFEWTSMIHVHVHVFMFVCWNNSHRDKIY